MQGTGSQPGMHPDIADCLELACRTEAAAAAGERLVAARAAVELVKAYDKVLEYIQLVPLTSQERLRVHEQLGPVTALLRKYRLR